MLVASSFDLWQKDTFFAAAEEVQQSADIMESAYRTWERERREGVFSGNSDEFCRELQTALGTAKWQLEEFEKAIRLSYRNRDDDFTMARHRHFVDAIETQIARVEKALQESFSKQGNQPIRWVNLNEEECDDLAAFISGTLGAAQTTKEECAKIGASISSSSQENTCLKKKGGHTTKVISYHTKGSDILASNMDAEYIIDIESTEIRETRDDINCQVDRTSSTRRTWSSPDIGTFKVVIRDEDEQKNALASISEATPKDKGSKPFFSRKSCGDRHEAKGGILSYSQLRGVRWINKIMGQVGGCQRKLQTPIQSNLSSVRYKLALLLTVFLIVPLVLYST